MLKLLRFWTAWQVFQAGFTVTLFNSKCLHINRLRVLYNLFKHKWRESYNRLEILRRKESKLDKKKPCYCTLTEIKLTTISHVLLETSSQEHRRENLEHSDQLLWLWMNCKGTLMAGRLVHFSLNTKDWEFLDKVKSHPYGWWLQASPLTHPPPT